MALEHTYDIQAVAQAVDALHPDLKAIVPMILVHTLACDIMRALVVQGLTWGGLDYWSSH